MMTKDFLFDINVDSSEIHVATQSQILLGKSVGVFDQNVYFYCKR